MFGANCAPMLHRGSHYSQTDWNELPLGWHHLGVPSGASKWFPCLWYVWRKPCTYLAPILTLSPNGPKQASTWHTLPRSTIRCAQSHLYARGTLSANRAPIYAYINTISKRIKMSFHFTTSPRSTIVCAQIDVHAYGTFGAKRAPMSC
jgi:hypothetical protein